MGSPVLRFYLSVRKPKNFLILLCIFIVTSLLLHFVRGYDSDFGATNLILSIEATIAGAVLMMVAEQSSETQGRMLAALLEMAEAQRDMLKDNLARDEKILALLMKEQNHERI